MFIISTRMEQTPATLIEDGDRNLAMAASWGGGAKDEVDEDVCDGAIKSLKLKSNQVPLYPPHPFNKHMK